jgi:methyl-accepting chemotaxis protein
MTRSFRRNLHWMTVGIALLAPAAALAQARGGVTGGDGMGQQEREMLGIAQDFARRCTEVLETWISSKEVTEEKLFSSLYYPVQKTDPPKFTTEWDRFSDRDIQAIEEAILSRSSTIVYAVMVDKNGYLPTHNLRYSQPLTGNLANDLVNNRTKRIFNDQTGMAAAKNKSPFFFNKYQRDTGEVMVDLSVPLVIHGSHWGAVRIGYRLVDAR